MPVFAICDCSRFTPDGIARHWAEAGSFLQHRRRTAHRWHRRIQARSTVRLPHRAHLHPAMNDG